MNYHQPRQRFPRYGFQQPEYPLANYTGQTSRPISPHWRGRAQGLHYHRGNWRRGRGQYWHKESRGRQGNGQECRPYQAGDNIEQYYKPSMLQDPWKHLTNKHRQREEEGESNPAERAEVQQPELLTSDSSQVTQTQEAYLQ